MRRKLLTLHLDGKKLNQETVNTLQAVVEFAALHHEPVIHVNANKDIVILVGGRWDTTEFTK